MSQKLNELIEFQTEMLRKQAKLKADHLPAIKCRYQLKAGIPCIVQQSQVDCLVCTEEHIKAKEERQSL